MDILVIGRQPQILSAAKTHLDLPDVRVHGATTASRVTAVMQSQPIAHVFMGPALPIETRLAIVKAVFEESDTTCVHLKDFSRGPEGALDFIRGIVRGLNAEYDRSDLETAPAPEG
jgi:DNA-binding NtrC family response regulator